MTLVLSAFTLHMAIGAQVLKVLGVGWGEGMYSRSV